MIYQGKAQYRIREVILHTSATPGDWSKGKTVEQMRDEIRGWHKAQGWRDIGYHRVVAPDGSIAIGRSIHEIGAHVRERNRGTIGICMVPVRTHAGVKTFETYFTPEQRKAVRNYLAELQDYAGGDIAWVTGHNDYTNQKECPGFKVRTEDWL